MKKFKLIITSFIVLFSVGIYSIEANQKVENFRLNDQLGNSHELFYYSDHEALVFLVQGNGCPIARNASVRFHELEEMYSGKKVKFFMLNSNLQDSKTSILEEAGSYDYKLPILMDDTQLIGEALEITRTGEVFIVDPKTWKVAYTGALDDRLSYENQKKEASQHFLKDALDQVIEGRAVALSATDSLGCLINFPEQRNKAEHKLISYSQDIAPILIDNCTVCHRKGGLGPWAMTDYNMIKGFSLMMREVVRTKRMPPWHADPSIGHFSNDRSLSSDEMKTLVHWIESGSPRGEGNDPLLEAEISESVWSNESELGPPDYVIEIPTTDIPATGVVDYKYHFVKNNIKEDIWVKATEIVPGDKAVLHHVITSFGEVNLKGPRKGRLNFRTMKGLRGYAPGITTNPFPDNSGIFLPADVTFEFQVHYTPVGRKTVDSSKMGVWVLDEAPEHEIFTKSMINSRIKIPARAKNHQEFDTMTVKKDSLLYSVLPHAHYRGKAMEVSVIYPDGEEDILLSVPNYDFNWQTSYDFKEPVFIPKGSKLKQINWWDNSKQNLANPDPSVDVYWGDQSFEEMLFGAYMMRHLKEDEVVSSQTSENYRASTKD
jgi:hypothetical protein